MARRYNFNPGPAALPDEVIGRIAHDLPEWRGSGASVLEVSHRGTAFREVAARAEAELRRLMGIPPEYRVLFLAGGASGQFAAVPLNLMGDAGRADYVHTGHWSAKAIAEARRYGEVNVVASNEAGGHTSIPPRDAWRLSRDAAYVHYTPNETIAGIEFPWVPEVGDVPLVADMSSNILSAPVDVSRFGVIYAAAQKNLGPAGLAAVIVHETLLDRAAAHTPSILNYRVQADAGSMYNTPPTFAWYVTGLVLDWVGEQGGLEAMAERNRRKADALYAAIDGSDLYINSVDPACRSRMNVPFQLVDPGLDARFLEEAEAGGLMGLKGHRAAGGMRASLYNAMPEAGVAALIEFMHDFERRCG